MLWEKAEQIDTNKCEDIKCYLAAIAKHEAINERNKIRPHVELDEDVRFLVQKATEKEGFEPSRRY